MKKASHTFKLANQTITIYYEVSSLEKDYISLVVDTLEEALKLAFSYRHTNSTNIETTTDGRFLVIVYKTR